MILATLEIANHRQVHSNSCHGARLGDEDAAAEQRLKRTHRRLASSQDVEVGWNLANSLPRDPSIWFPNLVPLQRLSAKIWGAECGQLVGLCQSTKPTLLPSTWYIFFRS